MIAAAAHIVFIWVLGMTMASKPVKEPTPQPEMKQEQKAPELTPVQPVASPSPSINKPGV